MWECRNANELIDYKLIWLRAKPKIWIIPLAVVLGAVLILGIHYLDKMIDHGGRVYETTSVFYLDFAEASDGSQYDFINYYTWGELIHSDFFMDALYEALDYAYSKDDLLGIVAATIESDVRYLYVRCTTNSAEESLKIAKELEPIVISFADEQKEFTDIKLVDRGDTIRDSTKLRLANAAGLGAVLGLLLSVLGILAVVVADSSVYIPSTLEKRYSIPVLGSPSMSEYMMNCKLMLEEVDNIAYVSIDGENEIPDFAGKSAVLIEDSLSNEDSIRKIKSCGVLVLGVEAGRKNSKIIERYIEEFRRLNIKVSALVLNHVDDRLIKAYYKA